MREQIFRHNKVMGKGGEKELTWPPSPGSSINKTARLHYEHIYLLIFTQQANFVVEHSSPDIHCVYNTN